MFDAGYHVERTAGEVRRHTQLNPLRFGFGSSWRQIAVYFALYWLHNKFPPRSASDFEWVSLTIGLKGQFLWWIYDGRCVGRLSLMAQTLDPCCDGEFPMACGRSVGRNFYGWMDGWKLSGIVSGVLWMFLIVLLSLLVGCFECVFLVSKCNREELWDFGIFSIDRKSGTHETLYQNHPWKRGISGGRITTPIQSTRYRKDITLGCTNSLRMYLSKSKSKISRFQINIEYWRAHIYTVGSLEVASIHLQASVNVGI